MLQKYHKKLEEFGLNENEIKVYLMLFTDGSDTASNIAKAVQLNRSTTYVQITSLMSYGLVSSYKVEKKTYFSAESPQNLERLLDLKIETLQNQRSDIHNLLPELLQAFSTHSVKPVIRNFQGKEGLASMRNEIFTCTDDRIRILTNIEDLYRIFNAKEIEEYTQKRFEQTIESYVIYNLSKGEDYVPYKYQHLKRLRKKNSHYACDIYIYGHTVSFAAMKKEIVGVSIDQPDIALTMKTLFDSLWKDLK